jgi:hypothetical protein
MFATAVRQIRKAHYVVAAVPINHRVHLIHQTDKAIRYRVKTKSFMYSQNRAKEGEKKYRINHTTSFWQ